MKNNFKINFFAVFLLFIAPLAHAASLSLVANRTSTLINQPFSVSMALDTQGDDANAIQGEIDFPAGQFQIRTINDAGSPFSFWIEPPAETASGTISFSGIVPDGFEGAASSVITVWFLPVTAGSGAISLGNVQLLQNDGQGTPLSIATTSSLTINVSSTVATTTASRPTSFVTPDTFTPVVSHDPNIFGDKYFLAFSTTDEGSGVDHYEVLEVPTGKGSDVSRTWQVATSPYLLQDQSLSSDIYVRAVDHDGNFIVVEIPAEHPASGPLGAVGISGWIMILIILMALIILGVVIWGLVQMVLWLRRR